jgi:hypothetical protein
MSTRSSWRLVLVPALFAVATVAVAQRPAAPVFVVRTAAGKDVSGPLRSLAADWSLEVGGEKGPVSVAGDDLISLRQAKVVLPPMPEGLQLLLANGDRIPIESPRLDGERLNFKNDDLGGETSLPMAAIAVLWRTAPDRTDDAITLRRRLITQTRKRDTVLLRNGDVLSGDLSSLSGDEVVLDADKRTVKAPFAQVAALSLNSELTDKLQPKGPCAHVVLVNSGARLTLTSATCRDGTLEGQTAFGARLRVPLERVAALDVQGGRAVCLSDMAASAYEYFPYLDERWPLVRDGNAAGHDLQVGGSTYARGIGLHGPCRVSYRLDGAYRRFEALVGLDDADGAEGDVRVRVLADGKEVDSASRELRHSDGAVPVTISVAGVKELTLVVELGRGGNVQDLVDWVDARLIR